jgi:hypothetical protein
VATKHATGGAALKGLSFRQALGTIFKPWFEDAATWAAWNTWAKVIFGEALTEEERALYEEATGRPEPEHAQPVKEMWTTVGRRGGKSLIAAALATWAAVARTYKLLPGQKGVVMVLAADRDQAREVTFAYIEAFFDHVPMLAELVAARDSDSITLTTGIMIKVQTANFRRVRGPGARPRGSVRHPRRGGLLVLRRAVA